MFNSLAHRRSNRTSVRGFTLIELIVAVTICAILASIALPSYRAHVIRSHRTAAQAEMLDLATREQQFLIANRAFADTATLTASGYALPPEVSDYYTLAVTLTAGPGFLIEMTPTGGQAVDGLISLTSTGVRSPPAKWQK